MNRFGCWLSPRGTLRCGNRNVYFIKEEDDGTLVSGTIISDSSLQIINFAEDINVSKGVGSTVVPRKAK